MKSSILAIGTELTTGQIVNKNASTLSEKLNALGISIVSHLTVPDDRKIIRETLGFLEGKIDVLIVTGGLGPTSDDFTRDVLADWAHLEMQFDETSWNHIQDRLSSRGFKVRDMQKQQCFFPKDGQILTNPEGTANGFKFNYKSIDVIVLPGPPREIDAIWKLHLTDFFESKTKQIEKSITRSWDTLGVGESDVAFQVEEIVQSEKLTFPVELGYRVHLPYVEVKLTHSKSTTDAAKILIDKITDKLKPITVTRDFADVTSLVFEKIKDLDFTFFDFVSNGYLHGRLMNSLKSIKNWSFKQSQDEAPPIEMFENEDNFLAILPFEEQKCIILFVVDGLRRQVVCEAPMSSPLMSERRKQYFSERALIELSKI